MWCIYKTDLEKYKSLMNSMGEQPHIIREHDDKVEVAFSVAAMQTWVAVGHWHGSCY